MSGFNVPRLAAQLKTSGSIVPKKQGGDRKSGRIEAQAVFILGEVAQKPDVTLAELQAKLKERGMSIGTGTLWRFFHRRRITLKKRRRTPQSSSAAT